MPDKYCVYKHISPCGKIYIGTTKQIPQLRWGKNGNGYKKQPAFYNDILKYGWENIRHEILETELTKNEAENMERYYISIYKSNNALYGYNKSSGGIDTTTFNKEHNLNVSNGLKGKPRPDSVKKRVSECAKQRVGSKNPFYGHKHSEKTKRIIGEYSKNRIISEQSKEKMREHSFYKGKYGKEHNRSIGCICIETNIEYGSLQEAMRKTNIDSTSISRCCRGKQNTAGKYHWKYSNCL